MKISEQIKKWSAQFFFCYSVALTFLLIVKPNEKLWYDIVFSAGFSLACTFGVIISDKFKTK